MLNINLFVIFQADTTKELIFVEKFICEQPDKRTLSGFKKAADNPWKTVNWMKKIGKYSVHTIPIVLPNNALGNNIETGDFRFKSRALM